MSEIQFFFDKVKVPSLKQRTRLKRFISKIFITEKKKLLRLTYVFCSDDDLLSINKQFLKHDFYTDIITFNLSSIKKPIEGEIYISVDRVRENALKYSKSINYELHRVVFHGVLHLCGYRDKSAKEEKAMRAKEDECLNKYFKSST